MQNVAPARLCAISNFVKIVLLRSSGRRLLLRAPATPVLAMIISKVELRKIKVRVAKLRAQGHEVWTDDEVINDGWTTEASVQACSAGFSSHVPKEKQSESWDCGLACAAMVLGTLGDDTPTQKTLADRVDGSSVWSIDLAFLLRDFGVEVQYLTTALSVDATEYAGSAFYAQTLAADVQRVNRLLCAAASEGVDVSHRTLSATELWNLMSEEETLIIALVDQRVLHTRINPSRPPSRPASRPPSRQNSSADLAAMVAAAAVTASSSMTAPSPKLQRPSKGAKAKMARRSASSVDLASLAEEDGTDLSAPGSPAKGASKAAEDSGCGGLSGGLSGGLGGLGSKGGGKSGRAASCVDLAALGRNNKGGGGGGSRAGSRGGSRAGSRASSYVDLTALAEAAAAAAESSASSDEDDAPPYQGHYVLILGIDDARGGFIINDPGRDDEVPFFTDFCTAPRLAFLSLRTFTDLF